MITVGRLTWGPIKIIIEITLMVNYVARFDQLILEGQMNELERCPWPRLVYP